MKTILVCITLCLFYQTQATKVASSRQATKDCQVCQYIMKYIRYQSGQTSLPYKLVQEKLSELRKTAPNTFKVKQYLNQIDAISSIILEGDDAEKVCQMIGKCSSEEEQPMRSITECKTCVVIVDLIKFEVTVANATVPTIIKGVKDLCVILGSTYVKKECDLILKDINKIIQWIEEQLDPGEICKRLGLCPNATYSTTLEVDKVYTCHAVVHNLRIQNRNGWSENKMREKVTPICNKLGLNKFYCKSIQSNFKTVLIMIKRGRRTDNICGGKALSGGVLSLKTSEPSNYCDFCMMIMETIDSQLDNMQNGIKSIQEKLDGMCDELEEIATQCKYVVDFVTRDIERNLFYIEDKLDPKATCEALKLCSTSF